MIFSFMVKIKWDLILSSEESVLECCCAQMNVVILQCSEASGVCKYYVFIYMVGCWILLGDYWRRIFDS